MMMYMYVYVSVAVDARKKAGTMILGLGVQGPLRDKRKLGCRRVAYLDLVERDLNPKPLNPKP